MRQQLLAAIAARFSAYEDLARGIEDHQLGTKPDVPRHKSLLDHLWCVVGARESYTRALAAGEWQGFSCSLAEYTTAEISEKLHDSAATFLTTAAAVTEWSEARHEILVTLSEHEAMHEGGIIRHLYALDMTPPESFKWA